MAIGSKDLIKYGYKYKPSTASFFKPATGIEVKTPEQQKQQLTSSLTGQVANLERRFEGVQQPTKEAPGGFVSDFLGKGTKPVVDERNIIEKALNLTKDQNFVMDILEILDRPREVVSNIISSIGEADKRDVLTAAWEGLSGKSKISSNEAVKNLTGIDLADSAEDIAIRLFGDSGKNIGVDDLAKFTVNFALDNALDPMSYGWARRLIMAPFKAFGKAVVSAGTKALSVLDDFADVAYQSSKSPLVKKAADNWIKAREFFNELSYNLNATKDLKDATIAAERQIYGETFLTTGEAYEKLTAARVEILKTVSDDLKPKVGRYLSDLIQSGAEVVKRNGRYSIVFKTADGLAPVRKFNVKDFLNRVKQNAKTQAFQDVGEIAEGVGKGVTKEAKKAYNAVMLPNISADAQEEAFKDLDFLLNGGNRPPINGQAVRFAGLNNLSTLPPRAPGQKPLFEIITENPLTGRNLTGYTLSSGQKAFINKINTKLQQGLPIATRDLKKYNKYLRTIQRGKRSVSIIFNGNAKDIEAVLRGVKDFGEEATQFNLLNVLDPNAFAPSLGAIELSREVRSFVAKYGKAAKKTLDSLRDVRETTRRLMQQNGEFFVWQSVFDNGMEYMRRNPSEEASQFFKTQVKALKSKQIRGGINEFITRKYDEQLLTSEINKNLKAIWGTKNDLFNPDAFESLEDFILVAQQKVTGSRMTKLLLGVQYDPGITKIADPNRIYRITEGGKEIATRYVKTSAFGTRARPGTLVGEAFTKTKKVTGEIQGSLFMSFDKNITADQLKKLMPKSFMVLPNNNFKETFKRIYNNLPKEMQENFAELLGSAGAGGEIVGMQRSAYNMLQNIERTFVEVEGWAKVYDNAISVWKGLNLVTPGFHLRNLMGNSSQMFLSGMSAGDVLSYSTKALARRYEWKRLKEIIAKTGRDVLNPEQLRFVDEVDEFFKTGGAQSKRALRDIEDVQRYVDTLKKGQGKEGIGAFYSKVVEFNFNLAEDLDDWNRYATYLWAMDKYKDPVKAFNVVNETLFDYTHLTPFERDVMKRLIPFYTFMKNNIKFQIGNVMKMPQQYTKMLRAYKYFSEDIAGVKPEDMPDYMSGNLWLPIPTGVDANDKETITFLKLNLPASDFFEFVEQPLAKGVQSLTFPVKMAWEFGTNRDVFSGAPITEFAGQKDKMAEGAGVLTPFRTETGDFTLTQDPFLIKFANELGLRNPRKLITAMLDIADTFAGKKNAQDLFLDLIERAGISTTKRLEDINITALYQRLEYLRNLKKLYEQEKGEKLPSLDALETFGYQYKPTKGMV